MSNFVLNLLLNRKVLGVIGMIAGATIMYFHAYNQGFDSCNKQFNEYKKSQLLLTLNLEEKLHEQEKEYKTKTDNLLVEVEKAKDSYNNRLLHLEHDFTDKLHKSEQRASLYQQMSRTNGSCNTLASHSARLDKQLTEGINLVRELRNLVELRDNQLRQCGKGLKNMQNFSKSEGWDGYDF